MDGFILTQSPYHLVIIIAGYLLAIKLGSILMKNRQPFELKQVLVYYNYSQIFFNVYLLLTVLPVSHKTSMFCRPDDDQFEGTATTTTLHQQYVALKLYDFLDTIFFVLRKKQDQISFLHVYHHILVFGVSWVLLKYFPIGPYPVGPPMLFFIVNCFVHAVMYTYYLKSARQRVKNLLWKKYVTLLQLVQHYVMLFLSINALTSGSCPYPKGLVLVAVVGFFSMVYLFSQFYYRAYVRKNGKPTCKD
ncbi:very long chain fatty acid elongase 2-like [Zophobas morio]|uniref:very long chain fatty acid elongase 2-like n=1 Tax=Zophobas morio TaxID=2755281 RepID=UPI003083C881